MCPSSLVGWNVHLNWEKPAHRLQAGKGAPRIRGDLSMWEVGYQGVSKDWKDRSNKVNVLLARNLHCFEQIFANRQKAKLQALGSQNGVVDVSSALSIPPNAAFNVVNRF